MLFLILSSADMDFFGQELQWRTYIIEESLPTTRCIELVGKKKFTAAVLDLELETYIVYVESVSSIVLSNSSPLYVHPFRRFQIAGLIAEKTLTKIFAKYSDFANIFFPDLVSKLSQYTRINDHAIKLVNGQQPLYGPIYSLNLIDLKILKAYIQINLANRFIRPLKSPAGTLILFNQKSDDFLRLYVDNQGLNNLIIKNRFPLLLIGESLDRLRRARQFTQLDLINAYYQIRIRKGDKQKTPFRT